MITQGRFADGLGQEFTEYILLGPASNSIHFISIKMCTEAEFINIQFRWVSGHNLESSSTWGFCMDFL